MKRVTVWKRPTEASGPIALAYFANGINKCGDDAYIHDPLFDFKANIVKESSVCVMFGAIPNGSKQVLDACRRFDIPFLIMERGFVNRRESGMDFNMDQYWSIGWRGNLGDADYRNDKMPSDRWDRLGIELKPYKKDGYILLCGGGPNDEWEDMIIEKIHQNTNRDIVWRPHPADKRNKLINALPSSGDREKDIEGAFAVVCHNSSIVFQALWSGCYVFTTGNSGAKELAHTDFTKLDWPEELEREQFFNNLGYAQWNSHELEDGTAWKHLNGEGDGYYQLPDSENSLSNFKMQT